MTKIKSKQVRHPSKTYTQCPCCKSPNLIRLEVDALCANCDWTSVAAFVDSGGMDNIFAAHRDHFIGAYDSSPDATADAASNDLNQKLITENMSA